MTSRPGRSHIAANTAANIDRLLVEMRPKLHRYCARMVGSVIDGEDVLQDALIKAVESLASAGAIGNPRGWLFRIAHNTALDFLRRRNRQEVFRSGEEVDMIADPADTVLNREIAGASLRTFMRLPVAQRASVILMDVLGCSLQEICEVMDFSLPAVKAALHRGRAQLRELANEPDDSPPLKMSEAERSAMLEKYLHQTDEKCDKVTRTFFQGVQKDTGAAFWNVGCRDKNAYVIMINNDAGGTTKVLSCAMLKAVKAGECFKKF